MTVLPRGVLAALATPLDADGKLDPIGLERLVAHVVDGGVAGISPVGSTGEGGRLTRQVRIEVVGRVRALVPDGLPIVAGAPVVTVADGVGELASLAEAGADAALVSLAAGYPLSDADAERFYSELADRAPLPVVIYNIPQYTGLRVDPAVVGRLAEHPNVAGIKDSSRDMEYLTQVLLAVSTEEFTVLTGTDTLLLASLAAGAHGTIAASINLVPALAVAIHRAFTTGDLAAARRDQRRLARIVFACRVGRAPAGWKAALAISGICAAHPAPPAGPLTESQYAELARTLADLGVSR